MSDAALPVERVNGECRMVLVGTLDADQTPALESTVRQLLHGQENCIVLELADVGRITSSGVSSLLALEAAARESGSHLLLRRLQPAVRETLRLLGVQECGGELSVIR